MLEEGGVTAGIAVNVRPEALGVEFRFQPEKVFERLVVQVLRMVFESLLQTLLFQPVLILSPAQWSSLPARITVRIIRFTATIRGFRGRRVTLVTTLLDPKLYPAEQIIALYVRRWAQELCFRDIKSTMGMECLRCKSPEMAQKELLAYLVAHNLVPCVMAEAVAHYQADLQRISFKGAVDALRQYSAAIAQARSQKLQCQLWADLLLNLARDAVPFRPNRHEPRAVKRRPKAYPLLNQPRRQFVEISHRSRYWKGRPRKVFTTE